MKAYIKGIASYLPVHVEYNDAESRITKKTGIYERHIAAAGECSSDMAACAAEKLFAKYGIDRSTVDFIILCTQSPDYFLPTTACLLQHRLGIPDHCGAFDFNLGCSGFVYGLDVADAYFARNDNLKILVIAVDAMSKLVDWQDRGTAVLFGDGAGAAVLASGNSLKAIQLTAVGNQHALSIPWPKGNHPLTQNQTNPAPYLLMDGPEVYRFAVAAICSDLRSVAKAAGIELADLDYIIPHQANLRIIEGAAKRLKLPMDKFVLRVNGCGNTSAASIPLVLDELNRSGQFKPGARIALTAFGGGLTTGACVIEWA